MEQWFLADMRRDSKKERPYLARYGWLWVAAFLGWMLAAMILSALA